MPTPITDVSAFTAPVSTPVDGDPLNAASVLTPALQPLANRTRFLLDVALGGVTVWPRVGVVKELGSPALGGGGDQWTKNAGPNWLAAKADTQIAEFDLDLPDGCIVTAYEAIIKPGAVRAGVNTMKCVLASLNSNYATPITVIQTYGTTQDDDGTINIQVVGATLGSPVTLDRNDKSYCIRIFSGTGGGVNDGSSTADRIYGCRVTFTDPGPRNA